MLEKVGGAFVEIRSPYKLEWTASKGRETL